MRSTCLLLTSLQLSLFQSLGFHSLSAADWPTFRGAKRTAVAPDKNLLTKWPEGGPKLVWESDGAGRGYSSLAIVGDRIYTLGDAPSTADDEDEYLLCFNREDGKPIWKTKTGPAWTSGQPAWQNARSTPTVDENRVFVLTPFGQLYACDLHGAVKWKKHLKDDLDGKKADSWGYSESVLCDGNQLVCTPGGEKNTMVALNKQTGETIWSCQRPGDRGAGHASIVIARLGNTRIYVQTTGSGAMGVRANDGKLLWTYDIDETTAVIPTPIVRHDLVFFCAGYGRGGALLKQVPSEKDKVTVEEVYPLNRDLANKHGGVVLVGKYLYGDSDDRGIPWCAELMTGRLQWKSRGSGSNSASIVAADGRLYIRYAGGTMTLVEANPKEFKEVGSFEVPGSGERPSWAHPVILDGKLYLREGDKLLCYLLTNK
jgi:hypothetical protein